MKYEDIKNKTFGFGKYFCLILFIFLFFALNFCSAGTLKVTEEHPFLVNGSWISASELKVGDVLETIDRKKVRITSLEDIVSSENFSVYNLEAGVYHDFVVCGEDGCSDDSLGVVVHNSDAEILALKERRLMDTVESQLSFGEDKVKYLFKDGKKLVFGYFQKGAQEPYMYLRVKKGLFKTKYEQFISYYDEMASTAAHKTFNQLMSEDSSFSRAINSMPDTSYKNRVVERLRKLVDEQKYKILYDPSLGKRLPSSLAISNTEKGYLVFDGAEDLTSFYYQFFHELGHTNLRFQGLVRYSSNKIIERALWDPTVQRFIPQEFMNPKDISLSPLALEDVDVRFLDEVNAQLDSFLTMGGASLGDVSYLSTKQVSSVVNDVLNRAYNFPAARSYTVNGEALRLYGGKSSPLLPLAEFQGSMSQQSILKLSVQN
jgi:hypothetical protein